MTLGIYKLHYDATTPGDGSSVAAFLRTGTDALTSTDVGGKKCLDVNIANTIQTAVDGVYDVVTNADPDNIGLVGHVRNATPGDAQQTLRLTGGSPGADNLDPANIFGIDSVSFLHGWDGAAWDRVGISSGALNVMAVGNVADDAVDAGNPIKVGGRATNAALTALSAAADRSDFITDLYRRMFVTSAPNISGSVEVETVANTAALFATAAIGGRTKVTIQNTGSKGVAIGFDNTVTYATGIVIPSKGSWSEEIGEFIDLWAISETGTVDVRYIQLA